MFVSSYHHKIYFDNLYPHLYLRGIYKTQVKSSVNYPIGFSNSYSKQMDAAIGHI